VSRSEGERSVILPYRRLDIALKLLALVVLTGMLALPLRNLSYAFSPDEPIAVTAPAALADGGGNEDKYVSTPATAQPDRVLMYFRYGIHYYYFPIQDTGGLLFARTVVPPGSTPYRLAGRLQRFDAVPFAAQVREAYRRTFAEEVPAQAWIVLQDESPALYQVTIWAYVPLSFAWLVALYLLIRALQGKPAVPWAKPRAA